jgi:serine/threonine protein kinase/Tol biopolymer transport system component
MREGDISHYHLLEKLGEGAMGEVYRAEDTRLKRTVALKFLAAGRVTDASLRQRFLHEAQAAASLDHSNICTVYEVDDQDGEIFIAMAYIDGPTLQKKISQRPLQLAEAVEIAIQIGEGLEAAHERGIVHRDIKSSNILLTSRGQAKITDFGLATLADQTRLTQTGAIVGTPGYMSPEQARSEGADARSDLWSLGVVLYEMVSGQLPFGGNTAAAALFAILHKEPEPLTAVRSGVPLELERLVAKALAKNPAQRYQHAADILVDLRSVKRLLESRPQSIAAEREPPAREAVTIGQTLGHYQLEEKLGEGGMGIVFRALDTHLGRPVAIKVLKAGKAGAEQKKRFVLEAKAASALNHPNIVHIYDIAESGGVDYIAMEFVEGVTLDRLISPKGMKLNDALRMAVSIADALGKAHAAGIVHRDLKPSNIMAQPDGVVKVLDFGLAKLLEGGAGAGASIPAEERPQSEDGMIVGTLAYMSPEQAQGSVVDSRSDIFSFGAVLYEMVTGRRAFQGPSRGATMAALLAQEPAAPGASIAGLPLELDSAILRCLRKDPRRRWQSFTDLKVVLEDLKEESDSGKVGRAAPGPAKRRRWLWRGAFAALAVLAAFAAYRWLAERPAGPFARMEIARLTDSGKASAAAVSPDGKYVAHVVLEGGMSSLSLRNTANGSNVPMLPPAFGTLANLRFSRDGNSLYYTFSPGTPLIALYGMPVPSGNPKKLAASPAVGGARFSPDEKRLVFTRAVGPDSLLLAANVDGSGERQLASRRFPEGFGVTDWSPDGKTIAYVAHSYRGGVSQRLAAMPAEGGPEKRIGARIWQSIANLEWLPDSHGLMMLAAELTGDPAQLWYISYPGGDARRITNDLNSYGGLSLTADAGALVTVQREYSTRIWVGSGGDASNAREIAGPLRTSGAWLDWIGDDNIVFTAPDSQQRSRIWTAVADGTSQRQLTEEGPADLQPSACGDGRRIVFLSYRGGGAHIWRVDLDGGNAKQLTSGAGEFGPSCSPDGNWLTYGSLDPRSYGVWRMPIDGGSPVRIWNEYGYSDISPDGTLVLVEEWMAMPRKVRIIPAAGGQPIATFDLGINYRRWSGDGRSFLFWKTTGSVSNIWRQPLEGGEAKQVTSFQSDLISSLAESRDGKKLAVSRYSTTSDVVMIKDLK